MRIAAISDIHGQLPDLPAESDLVIIAGDICPDERPIFVQRSWLDGTFRRWINQLPARLPVVATWGNHDFYAEGAGRAMPALPWNIGVDKLYEINGKKIFTFPWVPNLPYWAFSGQDDLRPALHAHLIPAEIDILVSHGPPMGIGDDVPGAHHVGSEALRRRCEEIHPPLHVCGHIHEARGTYLPQWGGVLYNVASLDGQYRPYAERWTYIDLP